FAWPGVYRARAKAIDASTRASELLEQSAVADKILEVEQLVIDIVYQKKTIEVEQKILDHMCALEKGNLEGYELGELTKLDVKKIEIGRISAASSLREAQRTLDDLYARLEAVTGRRDCRSVINGITEIPEGNILSEEEYEKLIDSYDPRLAWLRAQSEAYVLDGKAEVLAARSPGFSLGYAFEREGGETFNGLSASITLPVYSRRHVANSAKANALSARIEADATHLSAIAGMRSLRTSVTSMKIELNDYSDVFGDDNYASLLTIARQGGQLDNLRYLEELNFFLDAARARLQLEHEYMRSLATLNRYNTIATR
ncbi:MAG: TolC family protein, partial [Muribaculaceae bacterium]|nr:TolC family protein [Muribaculaceae bacterium]